MLDVGRAAVGEESSRFGDTIGPRHLKVSFHPSSCMSSAGLPHTDMRHYARDRDSPWREQCIHDYNTTKTALLHDA